MLQPLRGCFPFPREPGVRFATPGYPLKSLRDKERGHGRNSAESRNSIGTDVQSNSKSNPMPMPTRWRQSPRPCNAGLNHAARRQHQPPHPSQFILSILTSCLPPFFGQDERDGQDADEVPQATTIPSANPVHPDILSSFTKMGSSGGASQGLQRSIPSRQPPCRTATPPSW